MKFKNALKSLVIILSFIGIITSTASAAWYTCTVVMVGAAASSSRVMLTDDAGGFSNRWFDLKPEKENQHLATALSAKASDAKVFVNLPAITEFTDLEGIYMK